MTLRPQLHADLTGPNVNTGAAYPLPSDAAMIDEAMRVGSSPDGLGHAIGVALVRRFGVGVAYRVMDAIGRGIQAAMKGTSA